MSAIPVSAHPRPTPTNLVLKRRQRAIARERLIVRSIVFCGLAGFSFLTSSLLGNVMLEKARTEGKLAHRRTLAAKELQSTLQRQLAAVTSNRSIANWAKSNGFVATESVPATSSRNSRVAFNR